MNKYLSIALTLVLILSASQSALYAQNSAKPHGQKDEVLSPNKQDSKIPTSKQEPTLSVSANALTLNRARTISSNMRFMVLSAKKAVSY